MHGLMGSKYEVGSAVVLLNHSMTEASCLLQLCAEDDIISWDRGSQCILSVAGTLVNIYEIRTFLWEGEICPSVCMFTVKYEAPYMFW